MEPQRIAPMRNYNKDNNTRKCSKCLDWKDLSEFSSRVRMPSPTTKDTDKKVPTLYYRNDCKTCSLQSINVEKYHGNVARNLQHKKDPRKVMLVNARKRAKDKGLCFNIDKFDIIVPEKCPLLGIPINVSSGKTGRNSPSIDRIIPEKGYVKGNVMVISHKANTVKSDLSLDELELLIKNLRRVLYKEEELLEN
jgi:hypothetical protein